MMTIDDVTDYLMMNSDEKELLDTTVTTYASENLSDSAYRAWDAVAGFFHKSSMEKTIDVLAKKISRHPTAVGRELHVAKCIINYLLSAKILSSKNPDRSSIRPQTWYSQKYDQVTINDFFEDLV